MGKIIGEGITFDDVLAGTCLFRSNSKSGRCYQRILRRAIKLNITYDECRNGHCYRTPYGDRYGKTGWYWYYSQEYVD